MYSFVNCSFGLEHQIMYFFGLEHLIMYFFGLELLICISSDWST